MKSLGQTQLYFSDECTLTVRVRATVDDPYAGLKGHAYVEARGLNVKVARVQTSAHTELAPSSKVLA